MIRSQREENVRQAYTLYIKIYRVNGEDSKTVVGESTQSLDVEMEHNGTDITVRLKTQEGMTQEMYTEYVLPVIADITRQTIQNIPKKKR